MQKLNAVPTSNPAFVKLLEKIQRVIPNVMFIWIFITYLITAIINVYFLPLPLWLSIPASIIIQGARAMIVFVNFLNHPLLSRSKVPENIALFATAIALLELLISIFGGVYSIYHKISLFLFFGIIILFGYFLEINFVKMGETVLSQPVISAVEVEVKKNGLSQI
jgi:hypothetical protein